MTGVDFVKESKAQYFVHNNSMTNISVRYILKYFVN